MQQYGVALGTLDRAIANLWREGYIETVQGVGMFTSKPLPPEEDLAHQVTRLTERIDAVEREVQDHARLLARMRQRLEKAGDYPGIRGRRAPSRSHPVGRPPRRGTCR
jgi:DNA-binding GntR family transcriptional regulator